MALPMALPAAASTLGNISSIVSAGSSILGALGGFGKKKRGPSPQEQVNAQVLLEQTMMRNRPSWAVEGAKAAGIHPLVALGMSPYQGGASIQVGDQGDNGSVLTDLASAGQDVSRAIAAYQTKEQRQVTEAMTALQLERAGLENELLRSQIAGSRAQLAPAILSDNPVSHDKAMLADAETDIGSARGIKPMHQWVTDTNGKPVRILNGDLNVESEVLSAMHALGYTLPDLVYQYLTRPAGRGLAKFIRSGRKLGRQYNKFSK